MNAELVERVHNLFEAWRLGASPDQMAERERRIVALGFNVKIETRRSALVAARMELLDAA